MDKISEIIGDFELALKKERELLDYDRRQRERKEKDNLGLEF